MRIQPCRTYYASPNANVLSNQAHRQVLKTALVEEAAVNYKPLRFEDVAHLKVVWNLLIPARCPGLPESEGQESRPAMLLLRHLP